MLVECPMRCSRRHRTNILLHNCTIVMCVLVCSQFFLTIFDPEIGFFEARSGGSTMLPAAAEKYTKARLVVTAVM